MAEKAQSSRDGATASSFVRPSLSPLRQRPLARASTIAEVMGPRSSSQPRRRASFMTNDSTFSLDRASLKSSTDDLLLPRAKGGGIEDDNHESSHLHSLPLVLAVLPALGGMLFSGANIVITDITLITIASIFLNWSVRLPWDWYHSAQGVRVAGENEEDEDSYFPSTTTIIEEESIPIKPEDSKSPKSEEPPSPTRTDFTKPSSDRTPTARPKPSAEQVSASTELRLHELVALLACFVSPLMGAYILHAIRGQLSRPSEGLVSDYNLSIFILAAELRPLSHLIKMVQARTFYLQRIVAKNPHLPKQSIPPEVVHSMQSRLEELEAYVANAPPPAVGGSSGLEPQIDEKQAQAAAKKALQPDVDALTRAIRRYEKRATLLGLQTESRLNELEARLKDALTLAAGAERAASRKGLVGYVADAVAWAVALPGNIVSAVLRWALGLVKEIWMKLSRRVGVEKSAKSRKAGRGSGGEGKGKERERRRKE